MAPRPFAVSPIATHRPAFSRVTKPSATSRVVQRDALAVVAKYRSVSPVIAQSNDNTLRTVIPTLARQLGMAPTA